MHKGQLIITKAESKEEALSNVRNFLDEYKNDVWDWYQIGGRWSGTLCNIMKQYSEKAEEFLKSVSPDKGFIAQSTVDNNLPKLQQIWIDMGGQGTTPYASQYDLPEDGGLYDVVELSKCISIVKEWEQNPIEEGKKEEARAKAEYPNDYGMYGYLLCKAGKMYQQSYCFDTNVFNLQTYDYTIPEPEENLWVVVVDIHN